MPDSSKSCALQMLATAITLPASVSVDVHKYLGHCISSWWVFLHDSSLMCKGNILVACNDHWILQELMSLLSQQLSLSLGLNMSTANTGFCIGPASNDGDSSLATAEVARVPSTSMYMQHCFWFLIALLTFIMQGKVLTNTNPEFAV